MLNVDLRGIPPATALTPVPEAWYKVVIRKSNMKPTSKGDGGYLELICEIIEGALQGRVVYWNLNLFNPSQQAVEIAYKTLSAIGHCIGVLNVQEQAAPDNVTPMLHNIPFYIWCVVAQGNQGPINNVRACKDINGNDPGKAPGQQMPAQTGGYAAPPQSYQQPPQGQQYGNPSQTGPGTAWQGGQPTQGPSGGTAPAAFPGQQGGFPNAAPTGPQGQPWRPGENQQPNAGQPVQTWQQNPGPGQAPAGAPINPFPNAGPTSFQAPPPATGGPGQPTWQQNTGGSPPANPSAPWQR